MTKMKVATLKILAGIIEQRSQKPVVKIGRMCGQYGKPRSSPHENFDGEEIHSYFGDNVNEFKPSKKGRIPNPDLLKEGFLRSQTSYNFL